MRRALGVEHSSLPAPPHGIASLIPCRRRLDRRGSLRCRLIGSLALLVLAIASAQAGPPPACTGDCDGDESVSVDELIVAVRIALGDLPPTRCGTLDRDRDGVVSVDALVAAVANSLSGCGLRIVLGSASGHREDEIAIGIGMRTLGHDIVYIEDLTFTFDGRYLSLVGCSSSVPGKDVQVSAPRQIAILSLSGDTKPIPNGIVARCTFRIDRGAPVGRTALVYVSAMLLDAAGNRITPGGLDGEVVVVIPTPTPSPTETNTATPTVTLTPTATPTPTFTPGPTISVAGTCGRPGPIAGRLVVCRDKRVVISACRTNDCHGPQCAEEPAACVRDPARRTVVGEGRTGQDGAFSIAIPEEVENDPLLFEVDVADEVIYRTIVFGVMEGASTRSGRQAEPSVAVDPSSEGTVALLSRERQSCDPRGSGPTVACEPLLEDTSDEAIERLIRAVRDASGGGSAYAGLDAAGAIGVARGLAIQVAGVRIEEALLRAVDGTIYQVVAAAGAARTAGSSEGETFQVTTLAASSSSSVQSCVALPSQPSGPLSALSGAPSLPAPALYPLSSVFRTSVVGVPSIRILLQDESFDPSGSGRITVVTETSALSVCASASDCLGAANAAPVFAMATADSRVPSACAARQIESPCGGGALDTLAFGLPSTEDCSSSPTYSFSACGVPSTDGFSLSPGEAIVFIYRGVDPPSAFSAGVGGFEIDRDGANPLGCGTFSVVSSGARVDTLAGGDR